MTLLHILQVRKCAHSLSPCVMVCEGRTWEGFARHLLLYRFHNEFWAWGQWIQYLKHIKGAIWTNHPLLYIDSNPLQSCVDWSRNATEVEWREKQHQWVERHQPLDPFVLPAVLCKGCSSFSRQVGSISQLGPIPTDAFYMTTSHRLSLMGKWVMDGVMSSGEAIAVL
jgi:hypothetical protein